MTATEELNNLLTALDDEDGLVSAAVRELLICRGDFDMSCIEVDESLARRLHGIIGRLFVAAGTNPPEREDLTALALEYSLCPMHFCDYAICFDDDRPECAAIRTIHPGHDT